jgi:hypothetical protein
MARARKELLKLSSKIRVNIAKRIDEKYYSSISKLSKVYIGILWKEDSELEYSQRINIKELEMNSAAVDI